MMFISEILIYIAVVFGCAQRCNGYTRNEIEKTYPDLGPEIVLFPDENNSPIIGYMKMDNNSRLFGFYEKNIEEEVKFEYFSRDFPNGVPIEHKTDLGKYVNISKPTKCITHGWMSGGRMDSSVRLRDGFLYRHDANILVMDWSAISGNPFYPIPMMATPDVGRHYGTYLNYLVDELGLNPDGIHLVGHSLGAHVSGFAGREVKNGKVGRITGLDPALPGFDMGINPSGTLNQNDAIFVDIIHTCAGFLGYKTPLGHVDIYPNGGGPPQPGCNVLEFIEACSHGRSWKIFASSLFNNKPYIATKCPSFDDLDKKKCSGKQIPVGDATSSDTRGIYYSQVSEADLMYNATNKN
ncbi:unnamed protein product [Ceutorhynchus assimilis]|uniref:Lipase domain-containing protein n=1 Tax=Ceutorhynchus assimilis TaxID=467358 RepID=A0A9N9MHN0_9CUCU|nr:unnamed protein product [Ceutorhynchus assimilis]